MATYQLGDIRWWTDNTGIEIPNGVGLNDLIHFLNILIGKVDYNTLSDTQKRLMNIKQRPDFDITGPQLSDLVEVLNTCLGKVSLVTIEIDDPTPTPTPIPAPSEAYFAIKRDTGNEFVIKVTDSDVIAKMRAAIADGTWDDYQLSGEVVRQPIPVDWPLGNFQLLQMHGAPYGWNFHLDPDSITFKTMTEGWNDECMGSISDIHNNTMKWPTDPSYSCAGTRWRNGPCQWCPNLDDGGIVEIFAPAPEPQVCIDASVWPNVSWTKDLILDNLKNTYNEPVEFEMQYAYATGAPSYMNPGVWQSPRTDGPVYLSHEECSYGMGFEDFNHQFRIRVVTKQDTTPFDTDGTLGQHYTQAELGWFYSNVQEFNADYTPIDSGCENLCGDVSPPITFESLTTEYQNLPANERQSETMLGYVVYVDLEGGFYGIEVPSPTGSDTTSSDGVRYLPLNIQDELVGHEGKEIEVTQAYSKLDDDGMMGIFMWGKMIFVDTYEILDPIVIDDPNTSLRPYCIDQPLSEFGVKVENGKFHILGISPIKYDENTCYNIHPRNANWADMLSWEESPTLVIDENLNQLSFLLDPTNDTTGHLTKWVDSPHKIAFSTTPDGTHNGGTRLSHSHEWDSGQDYTYVLDDTHATLYYYCENHPGMGGKAIILSSTTSSQEINEDDDTIEIPTADQDKFPIGSYIVIGEGTDQEEHNQVIGHGSLKLKYPVKWHHLTGVTIKRTLPSVIPGCDEFCLSLSNFDANEDYSKVMPLDGTSFRWSMKYETLSFPNSTDEYDFTYFSSKDKLVQDATGDVWEWPGTSMKMKPGYGYFIIGQSTGADDTEWFFLLPHNIDMQGNNPMGDMAAVAWSSPLTTTSDIGCPKGVFDGNAYPDMRDISGQRPGLSLEINSQCGGGTPTPLPTPLPPATPFLTHSAARLDTLIHVNNDTQFPIGSFIVIDKGGGNEEYNVVVGHGSLILKFPLKYDHGANTSVEINTDVEVSVICDQICLTAEGFSADASAHGELYNQQYKASSVDKTGRFEYSGMTTPALKITYSNPPIYSVNRWSIGGQTDTAGGSISGGTSTDCPMESGWISGLPHPNQYSATLTPDTCPTPTPTPVHTPTPTRTPFDNVGKDFIVTDDVYDFANPEAAYTESQIINEVSISLGVEVDRIATLEDLIADPTIIDRLGASESWSPAEALNLVTIKVEFPEKLGDDTGALLTSHGHLVTPHYYQTSSAYRSFYLTFSDMGMLPGAENLQYDGQQLYQILGQDLTGSGYDLGLSANTGSRKVLLKLKSAPAAEELEFRWYTEEDQDPEISENEKVLQVRKAKKPTHDNFKDADTKSEWRTLYFFDGDEETYDLDDPIWPDASVDENYNHVKEKLFDGVKITMKKRGNSNYLQIYVDGKATFLFKSDNKVPNKSIHRRIPNWPVITKPKGHPEESVMHGIVIEDLSVDETKSSDNVTVEVMLLEGPDTWSYKLDDADDVHVPAGDTSATFTASIGDHRLLVAPINMVDGVAKQVGSGKHIKFKVKGDVAIIPPPVDNCGLPNDICVIEDIAEEPQGMWWGNGIDDILETDNDNVKIAVHEGYQIWFDTSHFSYGNPEPWSDSYTDIAINRINATAEFPIKIDLQFDHYTDPFYRTFASVFCKKVPLEPIDFYMKKGNMLYKGEFHMPRWEDDESAATALCVESQHSIVRDSWFYKPTFLPQMYWNPHVTLRRVGSTLEIGIGGTWKVSSDEKYYNYDVTTGEIHSDGPAKDNAHKFILSPVVGDESELDPSMNFDGLVDNHLFRKTYLLTSEDAHTIADASDIIDKKLIFGHPIDWERANKRGGFRFCWNNGIRERMYAFWSDEDGHPRTAVHLLKVDTKPCEQIPSIMQGIRIDELAVDKTMSADNVTINVELIEGPDHWHYKLDGENMVMVMSGVTATLSVEPGWHTIMVWPTDADHNKVGHSKSRKFYVPNYFILPVPEVFDLAKFEQNKQKWTDLAITDYDFDFKRSCFCSPEMTRPVTIQVRNNQISKVIGMDDRQEITLEPNMEYYTLDGIFNYVRWNPAHKIKVHYRPNFGYMTSVHIDQIENAVDDEMGFEISNFRNLTQVTPVDCSPDFAAKLEAKTGQMYQGTLYPDDQLAWHMWGDDAYGPYVNKSNHHLYFETGTVVAFDVKLGDAPITIGKGRNDYIYPAVEVASAHLCHENPAFSDSTGNYHRYVYKFENPGLYWLYRADGNDFPEGVREHQRFSINIANPGCVVPEYVNRFLATKEMTSPGGGQYKPGTIMYGEDMNGQYAGEVDKTLYYEVGSSVGFEVNTIDFHFEIEGLPPCQHIQPGAFDLDELNHRFDISGHVGVSPHDFDYSRTVFKLDTPGTYCAAMTWPTEAPEFFGSTANTPCDQRMYHFEIIVQ